MTDKPRDPEDQQYTGTGTGRSGDMGPPREYRPEEEKADKVAPNRSGSGGSGDPKQAGEGEPAGG